MRGQVHRTYGDEVALLLSLVITSVLTLALLALLIMEFIEVLPTGLAVVVVSSLLIVVFVFAKAVLERTLAIPSVSRGSTPVVRSGGR